MNVSDKPLCPILLPPVFNFPPLSNVAMPRHSPLLNAVFTFTMLFQSFCLLLQLKLHLLPIARFLLHSFLNRACRLSHSPKPSRCAGSLSTPCSTIRKLFPSHFHLMQSFQTQSISSFIQSPSYNRHALHMSLTSILPTFQSHISALPPLNMHSFFYGSSLIIPIPGSKLNHSSTSNNCNQIKPMNIHKSPWLVSLMFKCRTVIRDSSDLALRNARWAVVRKEGHTPCGK